MTFTIWGSPSRIGGIAQDRDGAHCFDDLDPELGGASIDLDHNGVEVGQLVYAEISTQGQINVVGVVDAPLDRIDEPVFLSGTYEMRGSTAQLTGPSYIARSARLLGISLTLTPSTISPTPIEWAAGDCRSSVDRGGWPISWGHNAPLLKRAVESFGRGYQAERATAGRVVDHRRLEEQRMEMMYRGVPVYHGVPGEMHYGPVTPILAVHR